MTTEPTPTPIGRLSEEEREALKASLAVRVDFTDEDGNADYITQVGHLANVLPAVERIVRAHAERAWDEAVRECHDLGWMHDVARSDALARNPYRAALDSADTANERGE